MAARDTDSVGEGRLLRWCAVGGVNALCLGAVLGFAELAIVDSVATNPLGTWRAPDQPPRVFLMFAGLLWAALQGLLLMPAKPSAGKRRSIGAIVLFAALVTHPILWSALLSIPERGGFRATGFVPLSPIIVAGPAMFASTVGSLGAAITVLRYRAPLGEILRRACRVAKAPSACAALFVLNQACVDVRAGNPSGIEGPDGPSGDAKPAPAATAENAAPPLQTAFDLAERLVQRRLPRASKDNADRVWPAEACRVPSACLTATTPDGGQLSAIVVRDNADPIVVRRRVEPQTPQGPTQPDTRLPIPRGINWKAIDLLDFGLLETPLYGTTVFGLGATFTYHGGAGAGDAVESYDVVYLLAAPADRVHVLGAVLVRVRSFSEQCASSSRHTRCSPSCCRHYRTSATITATKLTVVRRDPWDGDETITLDPRAPPQHPAILEGLGR